MISDVIPLWANEQLVIAPRDLVQRHVPAGSIPEQPPHSLQASNPLSEECVLQRTAHKECSKGLTIHTNGAIRCFPYVSHDVR